MSPWGFCPFATGGQMGRLDWIRRLPDVRASAMLAPVEACERRVAEARRALADAEANLRTAEDDVMARVRRDWTAAEIAAARRSTMGIAG